MLQSCFGFHFVSSREAEKKKNESYQQFLQFFTIVQLLGTHKQAEILLIDELNGQKWQVSWEVISSIF